MKKSKDFMPIKRFDDRIFFILFTLLKHQTFQLDNLSYLFDYEIDKTKDILEKIFEVSKKFNITLSFLYAETDIENLQIKEYIYNHRTGICNIIETINNNLRNNIDILKEVETDIPFFEYIKCCLGCTFSIKENELEKFKQSFLEYAEDNKTTTRIYSGEEHKKALVKYFKAPDGKKMLPNPKIKLSRITDIIDNYENTSSRYNFWHFFYLLEKNNQIEILALSIDEFEPTINFKVLDEKTFIKTNSKADEQLNQYKHIRVFKHKLLNTKTDREVEIRPFVAAIISYLIENQDEDRISKKDLTNKTKINLNKEQIKYHVNASIKKLLDNEKIELLTYHKSKDKFFINHISEIK